MNQQIPLRFRRENYARLEDYVGQSADRLTQLDQVVFLRGTTGTGKTHLLQGLCHRAQEKAQVAIYLPMLPSLDPSILAGLEQGHLICLDDIDAVISTAEWQSSLFHLVNACRDQQVRLVMSSTQSVSALPVSLRDLVSRLKGAYLLHTDELEDSDKLEVIRRKAARRGFVMESAVCNFILSRSRRDMHHLAQLVEQLDEETLRQQKKVTIPFVKQALGL